MACGYRVTTGDGARDLISKYLESGIPPILFIQCRTEEGVKGHAIVGVGCTCRPPSEQPKVGQNQKYYHSSSWSSTIFVHDDRLGPYREMRISNQTVHGRLGVPVEIDWTTTPSPSGREKESTKDLYSATYLSQIVVPLPPRVFLSAELAEVKGWRSLISAFDLYPSARRPSKPVVRTYLCTSNEFKERLNSQKLSSRLLDLYRGSHMSRYVWIVEVSEWDENTKMIPTNAKSCAEAVLDATSESTGRDFLTLHIPGKFIRMRPDEVDDVAAMTNDIQIEDETDSWGPLLKHRGQTDSP